MNTKVLIGSLIGGVTYFLLGWLIYGILLADVMPANQAGQRPMDEMVMWAMALSNLVWGYFLAMVFGWTNTSGVSAGAQKGAVIGLITGLSIDLSMYAMTTMFSGLDLLAVDIATFVVMNTAVGAAIGWYNGRGVSASE